MSIISKNIKEAAKQHQPFKAKADKQHTHIFMTDKKRGVTAHSIFPRLSKRGT